MSHWKSLALGFFATVCLLGETTGSAYAQCSSSPPPCGPTEWSDGRVMDLGGPPGSTLSLAFSVNDAGQAVGYSNFSNGQFATEWSDGRVIDLGGLPGSTSSFALSINDHGQAVGDSGGLPTEWSNGRAINLGGPPGAVPRAINNAGQAR
jgi:probable HAF family extracellular repeat protein